MLLKIKPGDHLWLVDYDEWNPPGLGIIAQFKPIEYIVLAKLNSTTLKLQKVERKKIKRIFTQEDSNMPRRFIGCSEKELWDQWKEYLKKLSWKIEQEFNGLKTYLSEISSR